MEYLKVIKFIKHQKQQKLFSEIFQKSNNLILDVKAEYHSKLRVY